MAERRGHKLVAWLVSGALIAACAGIAVGQVEFKKPKQKAVQASAQPVTEAEAKASIERAIRALSEVLNVKFSPVTIPASSRPVSRAAILREYERVYLTSRKSFRMTPKLVSVEENRVGVKEPVARSRAIRLAKWGAIAPIGPLLAGSSETLTVRQFGDSLGYLMLRIAELSHRADSRYSPNISP